MTTGKSYIPFKLFLAYAVLAALITGFTILLFSKNAAFSETEKKIAAENAKILTINAFLSKVHETESLSRLTIQSNSQSDYVAFTEQSDSLANAIDSLKTIVNSDYQVKLLDSVRNLLLMKKSNIDQLREIKNKAGNEARVTRAINELTRMEESLRKLELEDFVKDPDQLGAYQRSVLNKYVEYLNQNIPDDETNTLSQKVLDSMLVASRNLLNEVRLETAERNRLLNIEEKKLLDNELSISSQLQEILAEIETDIVANTTKSNQEKAEALNEIISIITAAAVAGLTLALFFSLLILNDFLKTKKYKKDLEFANSRANKLLKNREQLISTVSHDLKTPLSTISGYTELLGNSALTAKQNYYNTNIKGASAYISRLVQDLLDFTQLEAGKIVIENLPFLLPKVIDEVAKSIQSIHLHKNITLNIDNDAIFDNRILGDSFRLRQILTNLIGNAYKFTTDGSISISTKPNFDNSAVVISITDTGIGIAEDKQQLIFEEFTQADETVDKRFGGTGLGLTISKRIAEILGGRLSVTSSVGKGSTFTLEFPLKFDPNLQKLAEPGSLTIAIVDDDLNLLNLTKEALKIRNYKTLSFLSAREALSELQRNQVDLILTDIQMPEMNGFEFLHLIQQQDWFNADRKPIIAITGRSDANNDDYKEAGFAAVIRKPYTPKILHETILRVVNNSDNNFVGDEKISITQDSPSKLLREFFPDDKAASNAVLQIFLRDASSNLLALEKAITKNQADKVKTVAHKMAPMFRQLGAEKIGTLLMDLELNDYAHQELLKRFAELKPIVLTLLAEIENELIIQSV